MRECALCCGPCCAGPATVTVPPVAPRGPRAARYCQFFRKRRGGSTDGGCEWLAGHPGRPPDQLDCDCAAWGPGLLQAGSRESKRPGFGQHVISSPFNDVTASEACQ